jgi:hypothetical protein
MQRSRRTVLAALPVVLAGCGRSVRENAVPGGLYLENRRSQPVTVDVEAALLPTQETPAAGAEDTPSQTPETPEADAVAGPNVTGTYEVRANANRGVPDFFPEAGHWAVEAVVEGGGDLGRTRIELHAAIPGPTGADTVRLRIDEQGITAEATTVD